MPDLFFERHVPHLPDRMFGLVSDLEDYPRFLPNVSGMDVKRDRGSAGDVRFARMTIKFGPVTQAYTSRVEVDPKGRTISAKAVDGPFAYLDSYFGGTDFIGQEVVYFEGQPTWAMNYYGYIVRAFLGYSYHSPRCPR